MVFIDEISAAMYVNMPRFLNYKTDINLFYFGYFFFRLFQKFVFVILFEIFSVDLCIYCMVFRLVEEGKTTVFIESSQHYRRLRKVHVIANYVSGKSFLYTLTFSLTHNPSILAVTTVMMTKSAE